MKTKLSKNDQRILETYMQQTGEEDRVSAMGGAAFALLGEASQHPESPQRKQIVQSALRFLKSSEEYGDARSAMDLGRFYSLGFSDLIEKNEKRAQKHVSRAKDLGCDEVAADGFLDQLDALSQSVMALTDPSKAYENMEQHIEGFFQDYEACLFYLENISPAADFSSDIIRDAVIEAGSVLDTLDQLQKTMGPVFNLNPQLFNDAQNNLDEQTSGAIGRFADLLDKQEAIIEAWPQNAQDLIKAHDYGEVDMSEIIGSPGDGSMH